MQRLVDQNCCLKCDPLSNLQPVKIAYNMAQNGSLCRLLATFSATCHDALVMQVNSDDDDDDDDDDTH